MTGSQELQSITCQELYERSQQGPVDLIDVRSPEEYAAMHASNARNVPADKLDPAKLLDSRQAEADEPIYLICNGGGRSSRTCAALMSAGYGNVVNVEGGTKGWAAAGLPTASAAACSVPSSSITVDNQIRIVHGITILVGMALGYWLSPWWYLLVLMMGAGLIATGLTDLCGTRMFLRWMPWNK